MKDKMFNKKMTRRDFLKKSAKVGIGAGIGLAALNTIRISSASEEGEVMVAPMTFIVPRPTLEVMDDYNLIVAREMGYYKDMGIELSMETGPDGMASTKFVDQNQADVGYPSPGIHTTSVDTGMAVIMAYEMMIGSVWHLVVRQDSPIKHPRELAGATISVWDISWRTIVDPLLAELGIPLDSVEYLTAGPQWGQAVQQGQADVALGWLALDVQWEAVGMNMKFFRGTDFSEMPSNGYVVRTEDLKDPAKRELLVKFMRGSSMGLHFGRFNPQAAAQMTYDTYPGVREQMTPEIALESQRQLAYSYVEGERRGLGYGAFVPTGWQKYLDIIYEIGQTKRHLNVDECITTELTEEANDFDRAKVEKDAANFKLNDTWKNVKARGPFF
ncbi:MAG: ABC transporter substrate-binding protein [Spirochaetota bacterium]|nr:MAG: ABC transporter substrate-binding protein [Spirochaetota bacterium]